MSWVGPALSLVCALWLIWRTPIWYSALVFACYSTLVVVLSALLRPDRLVIGFNLLAAVYWWWTFWRNRPPGMRRRLPKLVGGKARAILEKMKAAMPKPRRLPLPAYNAIGCGDYMRMPAAGASASVISVVGRSRVGWCTWR